MYINDKILRVREVMERTRLTRRTLYRYVARGDFPKPFKLGTQVNAWFERDILNWIHGQAKKVYR